MLRQSLYSRLLLKFKYRTYGTARWMNFYERWYHFHRTNRGIAFSAKHRLSLDDSFKNVCLVGPTGSGKSLKYVVRNVLECSGSAVVLDTAGQIWKLTSGHMMDRGYKVQVVRFHEPEHSLAFNPLAYFREPQNIRHLAGILAENTSNERSEPFWSIEATNALYICLSALAKLPNERAIHLGNARNLINLWQTKEERAHGFVERFMNKYLDNVMLIEFKALMGKDEKLRSSVLSTALAALSLWNDPRIVDLTGQNSVDIEALSQEKTIIYLIVPQHKITYFSILINLFFSACFHHCLERVPENQNTVPIFFFLDEFGNIGRIREFAEIANSLRKHRVSLSILLQDLSQLEAVYWKDGQAIFAGGMQNKIFLPGLDLKTCQYVEGVCGKSTEYEKEEDGRIVGQYLMTADQVRRLSKNKAILISDRKPPAKLRMIPFYKDRSLVGLTRKKPVESDYAVLNGKPGLSLWDFWDERGMSAEPRGVKPSTIEITTYPIVGLSDYSHLVG